LYDLINYKLIEKNKLECTQNWCDLFGKNIQIGSHINRKPPIEKDPVSRILNRLKHCNYIIFITRLVQSMVICIFRLKSYDEPLPSPDFVLRLSNVQTIPTNLLYHQDHLLNIIQLNIKQIVEFVK